MKSLLFLICASFAYGKGLDDPKSKELDLKTKNNGEFGNNQLLCLKIWQYWIVCILIINFKIINYYFLQYYLPINIYGNIV